MNSVADVHEYICDEAAVLGNQMILNDRNIPRKWAGNVLEGFSQYAGGDIDNGLSLRIVDAYTNATDQVHKK